MLSDKKRIHSIRLLFELSNFVAFGIPLNVPRVSNVSSIIANLCNHIFNSFKKNHVDHLCDTEKNYYNFIFE